jgi:hypothetical protein
MVVAHSSVATPPRFSSGAGVRRSRAPRYAAPLYAMAMPKAWLCVRADRIHPTNTIRVDGWHIRFAQQRHSSRTLQHPLPLGEGRVRARRTPSEANAARPASTPFARPQSPHLRSLRAQTPALRPFSFLSPRIPLARACSRLFPAQTCLGSIQSAGHGHRFLFPVPLFPKQRLVADLNPRVSQTRCHPLHPCFVCPTPGSGPLFFSAIHHPQFPSDLLLC